MRNVRFVLAALVAVFVVGQAAFAGVTAYSSFNSGTAPDFALDSNFAYCCGSAPTVAGDPYGAGNSLDTSGASLNYGGLGGAPWANSPTIEAQGTLQFWVSPNWNGVDQGGTGVGGSGDRQNLFMQSADVFSNTGVNIAIFNNNAPSDGGQMFMNIQDHDSGNLLEAANNGRYPAGSTRNWQAGQWYHIAFTWSANFWSLWANGELVDQKAPDGAIMWSADAWLGAGNGTSNNFDGRMDELSVHNNVLFDEGMETYSVPGAPVPEPTTALLLAGGLVAALRRRR